MTVPVGQSARLPVTEKEHETNDADLIAQFLEEFRHPSQVNLISENRLAHMLGDTFIKNTKYEQCSAVECFKHWKVLLKGINSHELADSLDDCIACMSLLDKGDYKALMKLIHERLQASPCRFVLPVRFTLKKESRSELKMHFWNESGLFLAVFEKNKDGKVQCILLNKSEGAEMHRVVEIGEKVKVCYRFEPILLHNSNMFEPGNMLGETFLNLISDYEKKTPHNLQLKEIYKLFMQIGDIQPSPVMPEQGVTLQRSRTHAEHAVRLLIRHHIYTQNPTAEGIRAYERIIFSMKFQALLDGYQQFKKSPRMDLDLLYKSTEEFAISVLKHNDEGVISHQEWLKSCTLVSLIQEELKPHLRAPKKGNVLEYDDKNNRFWHSSGIKKPDSIFQLDEIKGKFLSPDATQPLKYERPAPDQCLHFLQKVYDYCNQYLDRSRSPRWYSFVHALNSLPIPTHSQDDFWDSIPSKHLDDLFTLLNTMFQSISNVHLTSDEKEKDFKDLFLTYTTLCAMLDKLFRRRYPDKLHQIRFFISLKELSRPFFLQLGSDSQRFAKIKKYLEEPFHIPSKISWDRESLKNNLPEPLHFIIKVIDITTKLIIRSENFYQHKNPLEDEKEEIWGDNNAPIQRLDRKQDFYQKRIGNLVSIRGCYFKNTFVSQLLSDKYIDKEFENQIMSTSSLELDKTTLSISHDLRKMRSYENMRISSLIKWVKEHKILQDDVKALLEAYLFEKTLLVDQLKEEPLLLDGLREMIDVQILRIVPAESFNDVLFWLRLGYHLETHIEPLSLERINTFQQTLQQWLPKVQKAALAINNQEVFKLSESIIRLHMAYFASAHDNVNDEQIVQLLSNNLLLKFMGESIPPIYQWINYEIGSKMQKHLWLIQKRMLNNPDLIKQCLTPIFARLDLKEIILEYKVDTFPIITFMHLENHFEIDFRTGSIRRNGNALAISPWPNSVQNNIFLKLLICEPPKADDYVPDNVKFNDIADSELHLYAPAFLSKGVGGIEEKNYVNQLEVRWLLNIQLPAALEIPHNNNQFSKVIEGLDGSFRVSFLKDESIGTIQKRFKVDGQDRWYTYLPRESEDVKVMKGKAWWIHRLEGAEERYHTMILTVPHHRVYAMGTFSNSIVAKNGEIIGLMTRKIQMDAHNWKFEHYYGRSSVGFIEKLLPQNLPVNLWMADGEGDKYLSSFDLPILDDLRFIAVRKDSKVHFICDRYPGYHLSADQGVFAGGIVKGVINLEKSDDSSQKAFIIPFSKQVVTADDGSVNLSDISDYRPWTESVESYFFYEEDVKLGRLISKTQTSKLFQILLLNGLRKPIDAFEVLEHLQLDKYLSVQDFVILGLCSNPKQGSPESAALNLKIALKTIENEELHHYKLMIGHPIQKGNSGGRSNVVDNFWGNIVKNFERYLQVSQQDVPPLLRLNNREKHKLLKYLCALVPLNKYGAGVFMDAWRSSPLVSREWDVQKGLDQTKTIEYDSSHTFLDKLIKDMNFSNLRLPLPEIKPLKISLRYMDRSNEDILKNSFYWLYTESRKNPKEFTSFDLQLFTLLNDPEGESSSNNYTYTGYLAIIFMVRKYPQSFRDLPINMTKDDYDAAFKQICAVCNDLKKKILLEIPPKVYEYKVPISRSAGAVPKPQLLDSSLKQLPLLFGIPINYLCPLLDILKKYFDAEMPYILEETPFVIQKKDLFNHDPLVKDIVSNLSDAFENHVSLKTYSKYKLKGELAAVKVDLEKQIKTIKDALAPLRNEIEALLHYPSNSELKDLLLPEKAIRDKLETAGKRKNPIQLDDLMMSFLSKKISILKDKNPNLSDEQIQILFNKYGNLLLLGSALDQAQEALALVNNQADVQSIAKVIAKERCYDPTKYPELLMYEYATGFMLRKNPDQAALLQKIFSIAFTDKVQLRKLFFEFQAGEGKTKVLATMIAMKAIIEGKQPVFLSLPELHDIAKKDLRDSFEKVFNRNVFELKRGLHLHPDEKELRKIYKYMRRARLNKACLVITPETYHALQLEYQSALSNKKSEKVAWLSKIDLFLRKHCVAMIDENHRNVDSLFQANIATGNPRRLNANESTFMIDIYKWLFKDPRTKLKDNLQASISDNVLNGILQDLADILLKHLHLGIPVDKQTDAMKNYLLDNKHDLPRWLQDWHDKGNESEKEYVQIISLARGMLTQILPHTLRLVGEMDYGKSINEGDELEAPRKQKEPTTSKFEVSEIAAALSIQGRFQKGLTTRDEMKKLIQYMISQSTQELLPGQLISETVTAQKFLAWQQSSKSVIGLEEIPEVGPRVEKLYDEFLTTIGKKVEVIEFYLKQFVLSQIQIYPNKYTSTAQELIHGFHTAILFSATIGSQEQYLTAGMKKEHYLEDVAFQAEVIQRACMPHNSKMHWMEPSSPKQFFETLYDKEPELFDTLDGSLDMGGWNKNLSNEEVARQFLAFVRLHKLPFDGVTYFHQEIFANGERGEKELYFLGKDANIPIRLNSTHIRKELTHRGIIAQRVFKIFAPEDTTGTDIGLDPHAKMLFILGEGATLSLMVQTIMRMRQFLAAPIDPKNSQSIVWIGTPALREKIAAATKANLITPLECFQWGILQEAYNRKQSIVQRAYQEIQFNIREIIKDELRKLKSEPDKQIELYHRNNHERAFLLPLERDSYDSYAFSSQELDIGPVLRKFADDFSLNAGIDLKLYQNVDERIDTIISATRDKVSKIESRARNDFHETARMETKAEQVQQARLEQKAAGKFESLNPYVEKDYAKTTLALDGVEIFNDASAFHEPLNKAFSTTLFSKIGITENTVRTTLGNNYKPIEYFLLLQENDIQKAVAVSSRDAELYLDQIRNEKVGSDRRVTLFTRDGGIVQNGKKLQGFTKESISQIKSSDWFKQVTFELGLLCGKITDVERLKIKLKSEGRACQQFWSEFSARFLDVDVVESAKFDQLIREAGLMKPIESPVRPEIPKLRLKKDEDLIVEAPKPTVISKKPQTRWKYATASFRAFFRKRKWLIPFYFLTVGILPLTVLIVYLCKYKKNGIINR